VHFALAEDIRALNRVKQAVGEGTPLPMALRENRIWGQRERLFERVLPQLSPKRLAGLLQAAHVCDGIVKGLKHDDWPADAWLALQRLAFNLSLACRPKAR
jgi:DNA polymerase-3 subunit delta